MCNFRVTTECRIHRTQPNVLRSDGTITRTTTISNPMPRITCLPTTMATGWDTINSQWVRRTPKPLFTRTTSSSKGTEMATTLPWTRTIMDRETTITGHETATIPTTTTTTTTTAHQSSNNQRATPSSNEPSNQRPTTTRTTTTIQSLQWTQKTNSNKTSERSTTRPKPVRP